MPKGLQGFQGGHKNFGKDGRNPFYGKKHTKGVKEIISQKNKIRFKNPENHPSWLGNNVGYRGLHLWINKVRGKATKCSHCGKIGTSHQIHWANISKKYKRVLSDWISLCAKCHKKYDKNL